MEISIVFTSIVTFHKCLFSAFCFMFLLALFICVGSDFMILENLVVLSVRVSEAQAGTKILSETPNLDRHGVPLFLLLSP